jgi:hypothetical protein
VSAGLGERLVGARDEGRVEGGHGEVALEDVRHAEPWVGREHRGDPLHRVSAVEQVALDGVLVGAHRLVGRGGDGVILGVPRHGRPSFPP